MALPATFPPAQDRFIEWLRRRAAAERKMTAAASQADALYRAGTQR